MPTGFDREVPEVREWKEGLAGAEVRCAVLLARVTPPEASGHPGPRLGKPTGLEDLPHDRAS